MATMSVHIHVHCTSLAGQPLLLPRGLARVGLGCAGCAAPGEFFVWTHFRLRSFADSIGSKVKLGVFNPFLTAFNMGGGACMNFDLN